MNKIIFQKQMFRHDPGNGVYGDCHPTALACLLGMPRIQVPHWHEALTLGEGNARYDEWLGELGFARIQVCWNGDDPKCDLETVLRWAHETCPQPFMFSGQSRNGTNHVVIAHAGKIIWDPALDDSGIVGPMNSEPYRAYFAEWIVSFPAVLG